MHTYELSSMKGKKTIKAENLEEAIEQAHEMERDLQPSMGVDIYDANGEKLANVEDGNVEREDAE